MLPYAEIGDAATTSSTPLRAPQASAGDVSQATSKQNEEKHPAYRYSAEDIANAYALSKLVHDFKKGDALTVQIDPGFRNFWLPRGLSTPLEDCIGSTIELRPEIESSKTVDTRLGRIRGVVAGLTYSCSLGDSGSASYTLMLNRVRLVDGDDLYTGASPLYAY